MSLHYCSAHVLHNGAKSLFFIVKHKTGIFKFRGGNMSHLTYINLFFSSHPAIYFTKRYSAVPVIDYAYFIKLSTYAKSHPTTRPRNGKFYNIIDGYWLVKSKPFKQYFL
jgi:hypothetical protein